MKKVERASEEKNTMILGLSKCLLWSYIFTAIMIFVLAGLLYKVGLGEKMVSIAIIAIYVVSTFLGGYLAGKRMQKRKFVWGLVLGLAYFVVLAVVSLAVNQSASALGDSFFTTLILCGAGGMMGGMLA